MAVLWHYAPGNVTSTSVFVDSVFASVVFKINYYG